jgi:ABC-type uncharacterized transport system involved in gliding motility auxiliary subunit
VKAIWTIARRELKTLFDQPTGFILLVVFVAINDFLFFRQAYLFRVASLRPMLELLPWIFFFFVPAATMRSLAEDSRAGTLEVVLAQPLTELELLVGKFLGAVLFVWLALALTLPVSMGLSLGADLHLGVILAQYVGAALLAAGFTGVGIWASALAQNQISAFIVGVAVMFVLVLVGLDPLLVGLPPTLGAVAARLGVLSHFRDIARGVIDLRDVIYFTTLAAIFLSLAYVALMGRKLSHKGDALKRLRLGVAMMVAAFVVLNLFGSNIGGRLDLTPGNAYTLSPATRVLARTLDDIVTIKLFVSEDLPPEIALLRRDLDDLLRDYRRAGNGRIRVIVQDPGDDPEAASEARSLGIPPIQFNVVGESQFSVREGFLGLAVQYADQSEVLPFVQRTDDLEYRLSSFIRGMTDTTKATVGYYVATSNMQVPGRTFQQFREQLSETHQVRSVDFSTDSTQPSAEIDVVVLIGSPDSLTADQIARFQMFFERGGGALIMSGGMELNPQNQAALPTAVAWNSILEPFGVAIRQDMVYDLLSNDQVALPTQFGRMILSYPFWVRALSTRALVVNGEVEAAFMPWTSSIDTSSAVPGTLTPMFVSSDGSGVEENMVMITPNRSMGSFARDSLRQRALAVLVNPMAGAGEPTTQGRLVAVGNTEFVMDGYIDRNPGNATFALNSVDWLAQDETLIAIRAKNRAPPPLVFSSEFMADLVKHANVVGVPVLIVLAAVIWLFRRRQRTRQTYRPPAIQEAA